MTISSFLLICLIVARCSKTDNSQWILTRKFQIIKDGLGKFYITGETGFWGGSKKYSYSSYRLDRTSIIYVCTSSTCQGFETVELAREAIKEYLDDHRDQIKSKEFESVEVHEPYKTPDSTMSEEEIYRIMNDAAKLLK